MNAKNILLKYLPTLLVIIALALAVLLAIWVKGLFSQDDVQQRKMVQQITVINMPPPPPPPPPQQKPPEPEPEEVVEEQPEDPQPEEPAAEPVAQDLGLDADGTAGGDGFGLVARKGGAGLLGSGGYSAYMKNELQKALMADKRLRHLEYKALVKVWFDDAGSIERTEVELIRGKKQVGELLQQFLVNFPERIKSKPLEAQETYYELRVSSIF